MNYELSIRRFLILGLFIIPNSLFLIPSPTHAARLYFDPQTLNTRVGQESKIDLVLDPEGEDINALDITVQFPSDNLEFRRALLGDSLVSMWISNPKALGSEIKFAGIMPGGFSGVIEPETNKLLPGTVASFLFLPTSVGSVQLGVTSAKLSQNDGKATLVPYTTLPALITIGQSVNTSTTLYKLDDSAPPDDFKPIIFKSRHVYGGKYALAFNATDKDSGVDHYEVKEGSEDFRRAESPYLLEDQTLGSIIYVRAIDSAGNERTVQVAMDDLPKDRIFDFGIMDILSFAALLILVSIVWYTREKFRT